MSEPQTKATRIVSRWPDVLSWTIRDERIGYHPSEAYAIITSSGPVCIDPLPLAENVWDQLETPRAVILTHANHQRSAWNFRKRFGCPVYAPQGAEGLDETIDVSYTSDSDLPGNLKVLIAQGFQHAAYLIFSSSSGQSIAFVSDLIFQDPKTGYRFPVEPGYFDPQGGIEDARRLLKSGIDCLALGHGEPVMEGAHQILQTAIDRIV